MMRLRAVRSLLVGEVASLRVQGRPEGADDEAWAELAEQERDSLAKAKRRALLVVALDAAALAVLFLLRDRSDVWLPTGPTEETVFTLGVVVVAVHLGFRLAQLLLYRDVERVYEELAEREA